MADTAPLPAPAYDPDAGVTDPKPRTAVFAAGCFWCVEGVLERLDGVSDVVSGYAGGAPGTANYEDVCGGDTGHAEVVRVTYDPTRITFGELMRVFFSTHDPTTPDRQGADEGEQYRSSVFVVDDAQRRAAEGYIAQLTKAGSFRSPIVTRVETLTAFHLAEEHHQDFVRRNPGHPYVRAAAGPKIAKLCALFPDRARAR
ncbi:MAG: peptide-methionine (S)-S-oxide reductase MsrA [Planctomycetes bacterium]|nr:peptide-methionine (S)-S-oxide reductase MsrA [Planctomycetota bacterium]